MKIPTVFSSSQPPETSPSNKSIRSTHSTKSSRSIARSVRTMKTLLPLTLSPCVPASPLSESQQAQRLAANDEEEERVGTYRRHRRSPRSRRDIPLFDVPANFPFPERTYSSPTHNGKNCLSMPAPPRQPIIVNDYELSDSDEVEATPPRHTINISRDFHRSPRWGGVIRSDALEHVVSSSPTTPEPEIFEENDATWVSSPSNRWNDGRSECLPYVLSQSMPPNMPVERWLRESSSWLDEEDDNILACATALAPAKANVVDVNKRELGALGAELPIRSTSLYPREESRTSWMTFGDNTRLSSYSSFLSDTSVASEEDLKDIEEEVLKPVHLPPPPRPNSKFVFFSESPLSPTSLSGDSFQPSVMSPPTDAGQQSPFQVSPKRNSLHETISDLETHLNAFPMWMMLEDSNCVSSIRSYLKLPSENLTVPRQRNIPPPSPVPSFEGFLDASTALESNPFESRLPATPTAFTNQLIDSKRQSFGADLEPLTRIFPGTDFELRSALYAHLLAYIFVTSLTPSLNLIPATPPETSPHNSFIIPHKAAELLGINPDVIIPSATKAMESQLVNHIGFLVNKMENAPGTALSSEPKTGISRMMLMALVEVVRACEGA